MHLFPKSFSCGKAQLLLDEGAQTTPLLSLKTGIRDPHRFSIFGSSLPLSSFQSTTYHYR